jgi:membrane associated rhomboid family serine protease
MDERDPNALPINPMSPVVAIMAIIIIGTEVMLQAAEHGLIGGPQAIGWRVGLIQNYGFFNQVFQHMLESRHYDLDSLMRFVTYPVVHASMLQSLFGATLFVALGKKVAEEFGSLAVPLLSVCGTITGALAYGLLTSATQPLIGVYPAIYALMGAYSWILWLTFDRRGRAQFAAFRMVGFLIGMQLMWQVLVGGPMDWIAYLAGFVTGFALSFVVGPDAGQRVRRWVESVRG